MTNSNSMYPSRQLLTSLSTLSAEEVDELKTVATYIGLDQDTAATLVNLMSPNSDIIFKYSEANIDETYKASKETDTKEREGLKAARDQFTSLCETNETLNETWRTALKLMAYPDFSIESIDKQMRCSTFSAVKGAFLLNQYIKNQENYAILNKACDFGIYQAFNKRLVLFIEKILNSRDAKVDVTKEIITAKKDCEAISNLYWSLGHLQSVNAYLAIADYQKNLVPPEDLKHHDAAFTFPGFWATNYHDEKLPDFVKSLKLAAEAFYSAQLLEDLPMSEKLTQIINQDKGLFESVEYKSWANGEDKFLLPRLEGLGIHQPRKFLSEAYNQARKKLEPHLPELKIDSTSTATALHK